MERKELDGVQVSVVCKACATIIKAPYSHVVARRHFLCDCGAEVVADMVKVSTAAVLDLLDAA